MRCVSGVSEQRRVDIKPRDGDATIPIPRRLALHPPLGVDMNTSSRSLPATVVTRVGRPLAGLACVAALAACAAPVTSVTRIYEGPGASVARTRVDYGTVRRIEVTDTQQHVGGGGALLGGLIGGVVGNQIGHGFGRGAATALGAVGGALVGNEVEHREAEANSGTSYRVDVRLDDGRVRSYATPDLNGLRVGGRVRVENGVLSAA
jgi:outer membrane lipoprotein SlyB